MDIKKPAKYFYHSLKKMMLNSKIVVAKNITNEHIKKIGNSFLILEPAMTSKGNLGDEALLLGMITTIRKNHVNPLISILHYANNDGMLDEDVSYVYFDPQNLDEELLRKMAEYEYLYVMGADIMDGHYSNYSVIFPIKLCEIAYELGVKPNIVSFSFNDSPTKTAINLFNSLPEFIRLSCRDDISLMRMKKITTHDIHCCPDIALTMVAKKTDVTIGVMNELTSYSNFNSKKKIIINVNPLPFQKIGKEKEFIDSLKSAVSKLIKDNFFICLMPHVFREGDSDLSAQRNLFNVLSANEKENVYSLEKTLHADEVKELISIFDLVVTGRMHMAIASIGIGKACAIIGYQGKCEGFIQLFDLPSDCLINFTEALDQNIIYKFIAWNYEFKSINENLIKNKLEMNIAEAAKHVV